MVPALNVVSYTVGLIENHLGLSSLFSIVFLLKMTLT